jgi:hypothetical protein
MQERSKNTKLKVFSIFTVMLVGASMLGLFASPAFAQKATTKMLLGGVEVSYNSPHLPGCSFDVQWDNYPPNTTINYSFQSQAPTLGGTFISGSVTTDGAGHAITPVTFSPANLGTVTPHSKQGYHVKLIGDLTSPVGSAKTKVFWIQLSCGGPPPPVDLCPNIAGNQAAIPAGMHVDPLTGDCVKNKKLPKDVCPNLAGNQKTVPLGMHVDPATGDCVKDPKPPKDVCPNIPGNQKTVPSGMHVDGNGDCVKDPVPPRDVCPNLKGNQQHVPSGAHKDSNGDCVKDEVLGHTFHNAKKDPQEPQVQATGANAQPAAHGKELPFTGNDQGPYAAVGSLLILSGLGFLFLQRKAEQLEI